MVKNLKSYRLVACVMFSTVIASCTSIPSQPSVDNVTSAGSVSRFNELVARDVVSVLAQINELSPGSTVLGTSSDSWRPGDFADALEYEFASVGYAIRSVGTGPGTLLMGYSVADNSVPVPDGQEGLSQTVTVTAGDIAVRRSYLITTAGEVSPLGQMQIRGVDASTLTLQGDIFSDPAPNSVPADGPRSQDPIQDTPEEITRPAEQIVQSTPSAVPVEELSNSPSDSALQPDTRSNQVLPATAQAPKQTTFLDLVAPSVPVTKAATPVLDTQQTRQTQNVMDLQQSNFEDLFADMGIVGEKVLTFANDSTRMGDSNKVRLRELVKDFNAESDVFSVVGCSLGQTNYSGGQEGLARGRATRVRDELLYAGIPDDNIVEEGCWAEEAFDLRMPRRGVVITLKRRVG